jgi:hypothetical protein
MSQPPTLFRMLSALFLRPDLVVGIPVDLAILFLNFLFCFLRGFNFNSFCIIKTLYRTITGNYFEHLTSSSPAHIAASCYISIRTPPTSSLIFSALSKVLRYLFSN